MSTSATNKALLRNRPFMILLVARTLDMLGYAFAPIAIAFGVLQLPHGTAGMLSAVLTAQLAPRVVLMLVGGVVADRLPRAMVLRVGQLFTGVGLIALGLLIYFESENLVLMCAASAVCGIAGAMIYPALTGIIPDLIPPQHLQQGNAWIGAGTSSARLGGLIVSGAVVVLVGGGWAVIISGLLYVAASIMTIFLPNIRHDTSQAKSAVRELIEGWDEFRSRQWLWVIVAESAIIVMLFQAVHGVLGPVVAETELGGAKTWTIICAGEALGALIGVAVSMVLRPKRPLFFALALTLIAGAPALLLGLVAPVWIIVVAMFLTGFSFELFTVYWMTTMQTQVPAESLSRVASYDAFGSLVLGPIGLMVAAPVAEIIGTHQAMIISGLIIIAVTAIAMCFPGVWRVTSMDKVQVLSVADGSLPPDAASGVNTVAEVPTGLHTETE